MRSDAPIEDPPANRFAIKSWSRIRNCKAHVVEDSIRTYRDLKYLNLDDLSPSTTEFQLISDGFPGKCSSLSATSKSESKQWRKNWSDERNLIAHHVLNFSGKKDEQSRHANFLGSALPANRRRSKAIRWCHKSWRKLQVAANDSITQPSNQFISSVYGCAWFISGFAISNLICIEMLMRHVSSFWLRLGKQKEIRRFVHDFLLMFCYFHYHLDIAPTQAGSCSPGWPSSNFPSNERGDRAFMGIFPFPCARECFSHKY